MRATLVFLLLLVAPVVAAPVPKAVKKQATADGVWRVTEFNGHNGKIQANAVGYYWMVAGDRMSNGKRTPEELSATDLPTTFRVRDADNPHLREMVVTTNVKFSSVFVLDGDTLRWAYATDPTQTITECRPADGVYYYVLERVKEK